MNAQLAQDSGSNPVDIASLRTQINAIDYEIAALIAKRSGYAKLIAQAKTAEGDTGFGWRPAREVEILRGLLAREPDLDANVAASVWRVLIATNLAAQGGLEVYATLPSAAAARFAFGAAVETQLMPNASDVLMATLTGARAIGVLPWFHKDQLRWWPLMMNPAFKGLHVCAASPQNRAGKPPEALLISNRQPEAAGGDQTLMIAPSGTVEGTRLDQHEGFDLVLMDGFVDQAAPGQRHLGCFALA